jgi:hypothetical protein
MLDARELLLCHEPASNQGFARLNWREVRDAKRPLLLFASPMSDGVVEFVGALEELGFRSNVWRLDPRSTRVPRNRRDEIERLRNSWNSAGDERGSWLCVMPFEKRVVRQSLGAFGDAVTFLVADDVAVGGIAEEPMSQDIRRSLLNAARSIVEMSIFASETKQPAMILSMRKAKEYPEVILRAVNEFVGLAPAPDAMQRAVKCLGRSQPLVVVREVRKAMETRSVRGGVEPVHKNGAITGWAKRALSEEPVNVGARLDGREIARAEANVARQDLALSGIGDGHYGFVLDVSKSLSSHPARIEVYAVDTGYVIGLIDMSTERGDRVTPETPPPPRHPQVAAE